VSRIAVTGASGFLGTHLQAAIAGRGWEAVHLPRDVRTSPEPLRGWLERERPAAIVHLAGIVDVRYCTEHPVEAFRAHVTDTAVLLEAVRENVPGTPVVYVATDKSFGEQEQCGLDTPYEPSFPYETSKACEDMLVETYATTYALPVYLLRFPNFFGEADRHVERLIPGICVALAEGREFTVRTRLDGTIRQYIYVRDTAEIVATTLETALAGGSIWPKSHFGPPHLKTVGDVIRDVEAVTGKTLDLRVLELPGEVSRLSIRDENYLGAEYTEWLPALERTARWYLDSHG
jgi:nucleoside-diphosphate-sugar epimerase